MRSIWSGAISFGLIYIPVSLYNATQEQNLDFDLLRRGDQCRIRYARVCEETGEEVAFDDIVKGYQFRAGEYVVMENEDFQRANVKKARTIEVVGFVRAEEIDQKYLGHPALPDRPSPIAAPLSERDRRQAFLPEGYRQCARVGAHRAPGV